MSNTGGIQPVPGLEELRASVGLRDGIDVRDRARRYTKEQKREILEVIAALMTEGYSLRRIFREYEDFMPHHYAFYRWLREDEELSRIYKDAMVMRLSRFADEMLEIADGPGDDQDDNVRVRRDDLRVRTVQWVLERMIPKDYGKKDYRRIEHDGEVVHVKRFRLDQGEDEKKGNGQIQLADSGAKSNGEQREAG